MTILVLNGPNLNMLGLREPEIYGRGTLSQLEEMLEEHCRAQNVRVEFYQSNHEGDLVDRIQQAYGKADGILINPAAYTHTSIAIPDAIKAVSLPAVEVHLSDVQSREEYRKHSYTSCACIATIAGKGFQGYLEGADALIEHLKERSAKGE